MPRNSPSSAFGGAIAFALLLAAGQVTSPLRAQDPAGAEGTLPEAGTGLARGAILKANSLLYGPESKWGGTSPSGGAVLVVTADPRMSDAELLALTRRISALASGPAPEAADLKALADFVRTDFSLGTKVRPVPAALAGDAVVVVARGVLHRGLLPNRSLDGVEIVTLRVKKRGETITNVQHVNADGTTKVTVTGWPWRRSGLRRVWRPGLAWRPPARAGRGSA